MEDIGNVNIKKTMQGWDKMKKKNKFLLILIFLAVFLLGCEKGEALGADTLIDKEMNNINIDIINEYKIDMELDEDNKSYIGKQYTTYVNDTGIILDELFFHIYPNAFKTLESAPIIFNQVFEDPLNYKKGYMDILSVRDKNIDLEYNLLPKDNTILNVKLNKPLEVGETITIFLEYKGAFPNSKDRFGYGDKTINAGNWYPILCKYDKDGWNLEPYYKLGDPFYSDISNYKVNITTSKDMVIASSGNILSEKINESKKVYNIEGQLIRDFAWVASKDFKIKEKVIDSTTVKIYYLDDNVDMADYALKVGLDSIGIFNKIFGKYPYSQYSIVMTEFPSGMEYPGIVFIGNDYFLYSRRKILEQIIVHETAHQWWYGLVGSDQVKVAWLDEGLTTYSETIYIKEKYGKKAAQDYFNDNVVAGYEYGKVYLAMDNSFNKHLKEFSGWDDYGILVYQRAAMFIDAIKGKYGEKVLYKILEEYFKRFKYYNATADDFIRVCQDITKTEMSELVTKWLD